MTLKDFYTEIGGDYTGVMRRLPSESFVKRFLNIFTKDSSYFELKNSLEQKNLEEAFRAAHTLKGVCSNLSLDGLTGPVTELTEKLRVPGGSLEGSEVLFEEVTRVYEAIIKGISELDP